MAPQQTSSRPRRSTLLQHTEPFAFRLT